MSGVLYGAILATALGCGLVAGVFFAFSGFVMAALKRLEPAQGIAAMQSGGVLYLVGTIGVTIARNVQLNERLAKLHPRVPTRRTTGPNTSQR